MLRTLEKYEILEEIGHGGMATVYRARDSRLDRAVALKVLHPHLQGAREARVRFAREAQSVARLRHPNVLEVYDYSGEESDESYIASELLTGPTLKQLIERRGAPVPAEIAACFGIQIARGLAAAHARGIIHRDVKPENVLVHEHRCAKLTDFGIAQMVDAQSFTATGQILGSPGHMAPEQVEGTECDARTDLFSLGTVLYYLAVGELPYKGQNPHQVLKRIVEGEYVDPLRACPRVGGAFAAIVRKAMRSQPDQRYQSATELEADLRAFLRVADVEDPDDMLASFLSDPDTVVAELEAHVVEWYTQRGRELARQGDVPGALDSFNRVLALDEGNEEVLALVEQVGRQRGRRRVWAMGAVALTLAVAGAGLVTYLSAGGDGDSSPQAQAGGVVAAEPPSSDSPMATPTAEPPPDASLTEARTTEATRARAPAPAAPRPDGAGDAAREANGHEAAGADAGQAQRPRADAGNRERTPPRPGQRHDTPRTVIFRPRPENVRIAIDDAEPRPFGPSFHRTQLEPGVHRFAFIDVTGCCVDAEFTRRIPPGPGTTVIERELAFQPAGVYVVANVPADVRIGKRRARGRTREVIRVPLEDEIEEIVRVRVTAPGHAEYTDTLRIRAGDVSELDVTLEPAESGP